MNKIKFYFSIIVSEILCFVTFFILAFLLTMIGGLFIKYINFNWPKIVLGLSVILMSALYIFLWLIFADNDWDETFIGRLLFPHYVGLIDKYPTYYNDDSSSNCLFVSPLVDDYWEKSYNKRKKTHLILMLLFYIAVFGAIIYLCITQIKYFYNASIEFKNAVDAYNNSGDSHTNYGYTFFGCFSPDKLNNQLISYNGPSIMDEIIRVTGYQPHSFSYADGVRYLALFSNIGAVALMTFAFRVYILFKFSCIKCGNVGLFTTSIDYFNKYKTHLNHSEKHDEKIGSINKKGLLGTEEEVAEIHATRKDHYKTEFNNKTTRYGCRCIFCGKGKNVTINKMTVGDKTYQGSSYKDVSIK